MKTATTANNTPGATAIRKQSLSSLVMQIAKFAITGLVNTVVDFAFLNLLIVLTHITEGARLSLLNICSFGIATMGSYFINKRWTFQDASKTRRATKFSQFLAVSVIGALLNSAIVGILTSTIDPPNDISPTLWANGAKIIATFISLVWNFVGYKFIVFRKNTETTTA